MKIFLSHRFTGEDPEILKETISKIEKTLESAEYECFCSFWKADFFEKNNFTHQQILEYVLKELDQADIYLAFIKSDEKSEGLLIEMGYALAKKKKIYVVIKEGVKTTFAEEIADKVIKFKTLKNLYKKLEGLR